MFAIPESTDPWGRAIRRGLFAYLLSRVFVIVGAAIAITADAVQARYKDEIPKGGLTALIEILDSWDGHWYLDVVRKVYPRNIIPNVTYFISDARAAFFPLYPRLVHYIDIVIPGGPVSVALLVNLVLGGLFIFLVGYLVKDIFDAKTAEKAMILVSIFPGSFVLSFTYSEALMLCLCALCFIALQRRAWVTAGVLAALVTATRPNGLAIVGVCAVVSLLAIKERKDWKSLIAPLLSPLGFLSFMLFLRHHTGENFAWFRVQREAWKEGTSFGATAITRTFDFITDPTGSPTSLLTAVCVASLVIAFVVARRYRIHVMYYVYSGIVIFLMLLPATVTARPRFLFTAFPLFFPIARALRDEDDRLWPVVITVMTAGLVAVTAMYGVRGAIP